MRNYLKAINKKLKNTISQEDFFCMTLRGKEIDRIEFFKNWETIYEKIKGALNQNNVLEVTIETVSEEGTDLFGEYTHICRYPIFTIKTPTTNNIKAVINGRDFQQMDK